MIEYLIVVWRFFYTLMETVCQSNTPRQDNQRLHLEKLQLDFVLRQCEILLGGTAKIIPEMLYLSEKNSVFLVFIYYYFFVVVVVGRGGGGGWGWG